MFRITVAALCLLATVFGADARDKRVKIVPNEHFKTECGACHAAFPSVFLPARSWAAIMDDLPNHFGEDASLDAALTDEIKTYLMANAADTLGQSAIMRGVSDSETPKRVTEMPFWIRIHSEELSEADFRSPKVKSKSNCGACHRRAG